MFFILMRQLFFYETEVLYMLETEFKLEYKIEESPTDGGVPVIVAAAGSSTRMNGIN